MIDLRSDTVTKPTPAMLQAMSSARVGDDVFKEDPSVTELEEFTANLLGHEAALFCPSGTMSNQIGIRAHTSPADEMICEESCHVFNWEGAGPAALSGISCKTIKGREGVLEVADLVDAIRPPNDHYPRTRMLAIENTHNRQGGKVQPLKVLQDLASWCKQNNLVYHLDGARLWNAIVATGIPSDQWGRLFHSVSVCFSKGLGAPVGSALVGPKDFIAKARRIRKLFGGGMRQAGFLAAGALYALKHHVDRLSEDHDNAKLLEAGIKDSPGLSMDHPTVETNIVWFRSGPNLPGVPALVQAFKEKGLLVHTSGLNLMRMVTHLDVSTEQVKKACEILKEVTRKLAR